MTIGHLEQKKQLTTFQKHILKTIKTIKVLNTQIFLDFQKKKWPGEQKTSIINKH